MTSERPPRAKQATSATRWRPHARCTPSAWRARTTTRDIRGDEVGPGNTGCDECRSTSQGIEAALPGSFAANAFGVHGTPGNVSEWAAYCRHDHYADAPPGGDRARRVRRSASWWNDAKVTRAVRHYPTVAGDRDGFYRFRVPRDPGAGDPGP